MKANLYLSVLIVITLPLAAFTQSSAPPYRCAGSQNVANCPPCYYNFVPVTSGLREDGREQVNVFIENPAYGDHLAAAEVTSDMPATFKPTGGPQGVFEDTGTTVTSHSGRLRDPIWQYHRMEVGAFRAQVDLAVYSGGPIPPTPQRMTP